MNAFDAAIRENRQGRILIADAFAEAFAENDRPLRLLRATMLVCSEEHDPWEECSIWRGFAAGFDSLALGESVPFYDAIFRQSTDGSITCEFRRK